MPKKNIFHYSVTALNTIIAILALYLAFSQNKQLTAIDFLWESWPAQYIPVDLKKEHDCPVNCEKITYTFPVWLKFKIVNTGFRAFSVDHVSVFIQPTKCERGTVYLFSNKLIKEKDKMPSKELISLPIVIEPGHSKEFIRNIEIPITQNEYLTLKQRFKGTKIDMNLFDESNYNLFKKYAISSHVTLAGGQTKVTNIQIR